MPKKKFYLVAKYKWELKFRRSAVNPRDDGFDTRADAIKALNEYSQSCSEFQYALVERLERTEVLEHKMVSKKVVSYV